MPQQPCIFELIDLLTQSGGRLNSPCCYLLKLSRPLGNAKHQAQYYLGSTINLIRRISQHWKGEGAAFTRAARERGIGFEVVAVWVCDSLQNARQQEKQLKRCKNYSRLIHQVMAYG